MKTLCSIVFMCLSLAGLGGSKKLPSYVQVCKVSDPAYDACVLKSIEALRPRLAKGIPRMRVPPLEPFSVPVFETSRDTDMICLRMRLTNILYHGGSHFRIESLKTDPPALSTEAIILLPAIATEGQYTAEVNLLQVPFKGSGTFQGNFTNIRIVTSVKAKVETTDGVKKLSVVELKTKIRILGEADVKLTSEGAGIADAANTLLNQNRKQVYEIIYPILEDYAASVLIQVFNTILSSLDVDEILPA